MTIKKKTVLLASILAAAAMTVSVGSAEARHGGWSGGSGGHWGGGHMRSHAFVGRPNFAFSHRPHFRHHHHRFVAVAPFYYSDYGYGDGCYWLKRRALYTGSGYWWNRYYNCINGYGY
jgi:hypothetical protein